MRLNTHMCDRSHAFWTSMWPFLGPLLPSLLHFPFTPYSTFLYFSHHAPLPITTLPPKHLHITTTKPPCHRPSPPSAFPSPHFFISPFFFHFFSQTQPSPNSAICPCFLASKGTIHSRIVPFLFFYGFSLLQGVELGFYVGFRTLVFRGAHHLFDKFLQRISSIPRGQASSSRSSRTHNIVARPSIESRKLILETSFAIKDEFSKNEAMRWVVQELKRHGLKRLFKPVASTAYERLV